MFDLNIVQPIYISISDDCINKHSAIGRLTPSYLRQCDCNTTPSFINCKLLVFCSSSIGSLGIVTCSVCAHPESTFQQRLMSATIGSLAD